MQISHEKLMLDARRAYELGRLRSSLPVILKIIPLVAISVLVCGDLGASSALGAALIASSVFFLWKGQRLGQGVPTGLVIGAGTFALPILAEVTGKCCTLGSHAMLCGSIGLMAGAVVGFHVIRSHRTHAHYILSTTVITILTASLGCAILGLSGTLGLLVGVLIPTVPLYVLVPSR